MDVPKEITNLIENSGNNLHAKIARWFKNNGWHVVISPYYMDHTQVKSREIDIVAEKLWPVFDLYTLVGHVAVRLFIECKYLASDAVFWFAEKDQDAALKLVCVQMGGSHLTTSIRESITTCRGIHE